MMVALMAGFALVVVLALLWESHRRSRNRLRRRRPEPRPYPLRMVPPVEEPTPGYGVEVWRPGSPGWHAEPWLTRDLVPAQVACTTSVYTAPVDCSPSSSTDCSSDAGSSGSDGGSSCGGGGSGGD